MRKKLFKILVTGGAGFIGSEFVRQAIERGHRIVVIDKLTYAGDIDRIRGARKYLKFYRTDICDKNKIEYIFDIQRPQIVVHFAAETHVDRSIINCSPFIETNIKGTKVILDASRKYKIKKFIHISTDEVYGEIKKGKFSETSSLQPNSPYAASKAAADLLVKSYVRTYGFPAVIVRPCNNYGPWQYPEKLIPLSILKALKNKNVCVYGKGRNIREWLFVSDCVKAIFLIMAGGLFGEVYNIGSNQEKENIDVVRQLLKILAKPQRLIEFVQDRPGHDLRYALSSRKIRTKLGWQAKTEFNKGLKITVDWYMHNIGWLNKHHSRKLTIKF